MSDVSKCAGIIGNELCPRHKECLRFTMKANDLLQSWIGPSIDHKGDCKNFLDNYERTKPKQNRKDNT